MYATALDNLCEEPDVANPQVRFCEKTGQADAWLKKLLTMQHREKPVYSTFVSFL